MSKLELTDVKIITKQIIINTLTSSHLIPITADEKSIQKIQDVLDEHEALKRDVARYFELAQKFKSITKEKQIECYQLQEKLSKVGKEE